ncbi:hypothetical protein L484_025768 [Morus notabilis]|uniref:Uncharacterized protein n=1 Tax=Morus notabilis TaxID=981085 RepID=W9REF7_9ROSA|nr:hypothetical protein L484_025768 [Morus notabilis]
MAAQNTTLRHQVAAQSSQLSAYYHYYNQTYTTNVVAGPSGAGQQNQDTIRRHKHSLIKPMQQFDTPGNEGIQRDTNKPVEQVPVLRATTQDVQQADNAPLTLRGVRSLFNNLFAENMRHVWNLF